MRTGSSSRPAASPAAIATSCSTGSTAEDGYLFQNSWGSSWGLNGRFKIKTADLASLLAAQGEACCTAELP